MRARQAILCQRVIEVQPDFDEREKAIDLIDINWKDLDRRAFSVRTRKGGTVRIVLGAGQKLVHGAVLHRNGKHRVIVNVRPCEVLVIDSPSRRELARIAYAVGNLHLAAEIHENRIIIPADDATEAAIGRLNISYKLETRRIHPITDWLPRVTIAMGETEA